VHLTALLALICIGSLAFQAAPSFGQDTLQSSADDARDLFPQHHTLPEDAYVVSASSEIQVVYIYSDICPPCISYNQTEYPEFAASMEYQNVQFRKLTILNFGTPDARIVWPADLERLMAETELDTSAPRWLVLLDGRLISNERTWTGRALPLIRSLVAKKLAA